ncbi:MAG: hypothetical protein AAF624_07655 [Bacteroidota bacterium]
MPVRFSSRLTAHRRLAWLRRSAAAGTLTLAMLHGTPGVQAQAPVVAGEEFQVNTYTTGRQQGASVAMDADGDFVIAWMSLGQDGDESGVFAQRFVADGTPQGNEFQVSGFTKGDQFGPSVAMDADGDFVIVWEGAYASNSLTDVYAQRYDALGTP